MFYIDNSDAASLMGDNTLFLYSFMSDAEGREERNAERSRSKAAK